MLQECFSQFLLHRNGAMRSGVQLVYGVSSHEDAVKIGGWQHVAAVVDRSSGDATYFVNGDVVASASFLSEVPLVFGPCTIGAWQASKPDSWSRRFRGRMDEFAIFNRALSRDEIVELFQDGSGFGSDPSSWSSGAVEQWSSGAVEVLRGGRRRVAF